MKHGESLSLYVITNELACSIRFGVGRVYGEFEKPDREFIEYVPLAQLETEREVLRDVKREGNRRIADLLLGMDSVACYLDTIAQELDNGYVKAAADALRKWMKP